MKNLLVMFALVIAGLNNAQATSLHPHTFAEMSRLTVLKMDQSKFGTSVRSAQAYLNTTRKTVTLEVQFKLPACARPRPGQPVCMIADRAPMVIDLPIVSEKDGNCGARIYVAKQDLRPVDGNLEQITLIDRRINTCDMNIPLNQVTQVELLVVTAGFGGPVEKSVSRMSGRALGGFKFVK